MKSFQLAFMRKGKYIICNLFQEKLSTKQKET